MAYTEAISITGYSFFCGKKRRQGMKLDSKTLKMTVAALFATLAVILSGFSVPMGMARVFPIQHAVNILLGVLLGPWYAAGAAFVTSTIRVLLGTGSLLAFPGSMIGACLCGLLYRKSRNIGLAFAGELIGTGVIGALAAYPIAMLILGREAALFGFIVPFSSSACVGALMSAVLLTAFKRTGRLEKINQKLGGIQE